MNLLLIDSTKNELIVALAQNGKIVKTEVCKEQRQHDKNINALIKKLDCENINAIAVVTGPGSWTGIRVGLAVAKAYAYVWGVPIIELRDDINIEEAKKKFNSKDFVTPFTVQPFYNGEFIVNKKNPKQS